MTSPSTAMSSQPDLTGTRDNLTPSQTKALYRLWQRFFRLCEMPAGSLEGNASTTTSGAPSNGAKSERVTVFEEKGDGISDAQLHRTTSTPLLGRQPGAANGGPYGDQSTSAGVRYLDKPLQRQSSNVRQIDERGSHIPKDDRVKDELKTLEEAKEMREFLQRYGGERLRQIFWDMVKGEHPDAIMLRFLRARKWNVDRAIAVIGSTAAFRADNNVTEILRGGELALTRTRGGMNMLANGISYIYGATSIGEPIYFIEVGKHFSHNQTQQELKKGVIFLQELLQILMPPPIERKVVIFNMNDFGIRNMDWWCVFFMVKTMESYYVETLSRVYVHGAPWIFKPIWAILKPLLDPVVRDKVRLTFSAEELAEHVPFSHLPKESMRGGMDWKFEYPEPDPHENDRQLDTETRDRLLAEYMAVAREFELATHEVSSVYASASLLRKGGGGRARLVGRMADLSLSSDEDETTDDVGGGGGGGLDVHPNRMRSQTKAEQDDRDERIEVNADDLTAGLKARRDVLATKLRVAFLKLRPYIVGKSMVERWGASKEDGRIVWHYRSIDGEEEEQVLGEGTTLPELERNLELIEQANGQSAVQSAGKVNGESSRDATTNGLPAHGDTMTNDASLERETATNEMNRRQQRLKNRSRPTSRALEQEVLLTHDDDKQAIESPQVETSAHIDSQALTGGGEEEKQEEATVGEGEGGPSRANDALARDNVTDDADAANHTPDVPVHPLSAHFAPSGSQS